MLFPFTLFLTYSIYKNFCFHKDIVISVFNIYYMACSILRYFKISVEKINKKFFDNYAIFHRLVNIMKMGGMQ